MSALILHQEDGRSSVQPSLPPVIKCPNTSEIPFTSGQADHLSAAAFHSQAGEQGRPGGSWEPGWAAGAEHLWSPTDLHPRDEQAAVGQDRMRGVVSALPCHHLVLGLVAAQHRRSWRTGWGNRTLCTCGSERSSSRACRRRCPVPPSSN